MKQQLQTKSLPLNIPKILLKKTNVRSYIQSLPEKEVVHYIAELYKGNGWIISYIAEGLAISHPLQPETFTLLIKYKQSHTPLLFEQVKKELANFERNRAKYNCGQFCLISPAGYDLKASKLSRFNMLLNDWDFVQELINTYHPSAYKEPQIQLFSHNNYSYKKIKELFTTTKTVSVVQATGTGKSFLIAKLLADFKGHNKLVMAPSHYILDQLKEQAPWETKSTMFLTYAKGMFLTDTEIKNLNPRLIVLDEYHRCGAEEWGKGVQNILGGHSGAYVFGTSATPIRYMDNSRDMSAELFNGNIAENLSLAQSIVKGILPMPKYVSALYTLDEEISNLQEKITRSKRTAKVKSSLIKHIDTFRIDWEKSAGIPKVLKKHLRPGMNKFIVFCKEENHLNEMEHMVQDWFVKAGINKPIKTYRVLNAENQSDKNLDKFKTANSKDHLHLLFSINMLNEGLHVKEVHGVILLRPTESPNIFYQQIGRCLKVGLNHVPVIFDFVNNFRSIRAKDFMYELEFFRKQEIALRNEFGLEDICPRFNIIDEVREITEVFGKINFKIDNWEIRLEELKDYKERFGNCLVPKKWEENKQLASWLMGQRMKEKHKMLKPEKKQQLADLGVVWITKSVKRTDWNECYKLLKIYKKKYGHCNVPQRDKKNQMLSKWVANQRDAFRNNYLSEDRKKKLDTLKFEWNLQYRFEVFWQTRFNELLEYRRKYGHCEVPINWAENKKLGIWVHGQRKNYRAKKFITEDKIIKLNKIGFTWSIDSWESSFQELLKYKKIHGHCNVPNTPGNPYKTLGNWVSLQRTNYARKTFITRERIKKLDTVGFEWKVNDNRWEKKFAILQDFYKVNGHCNVTAKQNKILKIWIGNLKRTIKNGTVSATKIKKLEKIKFFTKK